jgi:hypothetical protein
MISVKSLFAVFAIALIATTTQAQFRQPYNQPLGSFASVVQNCANPKPFPVAAADDFKFADNFLINHFRWWGTVSDPAQLNRLYYLAIYKDGGCRPGQRIYQTCAFAQTQFVGVDCQGNNVYTFLVTLPNPLPIASGHFWFRVAESDADSIRPGLVDFKWSGRRPVRLCDAGQQTLAGWFAPLLDPCDNLPDDLAFCVLG